MVGRAAVPFGDPVAESGEYESKCAVPQPSWACIKCVPDIRPGETPALARPRRGCNGRLQYGDGAAIVQRYAGGRIRRERGGAPGAPRC